MATNGTQTEQGDSLLAPVRKGIMAVSGGYYGASYIPDEDDPLGVAVLDAVRHGPIFLALRDIYICITMFTLFPGVITPMYSTDPSHEFYLGSKRNTFGLVLLSFASVFEVVLLLACVPLFLFLPGPISVVIFLLGQALIHIICYPLQGPSKVWSKTPTDTYTRKKHQRFEDERWFFLNGCCTSGYNLQQNVDRLSETFGRPVFAIHNRTYGVIGDLFECIVQRSFDFFTEETRVCYEYIKAYCTDPEVRKVVLIAHSQGCIMAAQILDQLYVDLPAELVAKLEVYTFGNAASRFNNPLRHLSSSAQIDGRDASDSVTYQRMSSKKQQQQQQPQKQQPEVDHVLPERVIAHIEHYCNSEDMVTRWGALFSAKSILQNRFCGHIFINEGASGHMLNQHYLSNMFPLERRPIDLRNGWNLDHHEDHSSTFPPPPTTTTSSQEHQQLATPQSIPFLDRIVRLDTATVTHRHQNAAHQLAVMRHDSAPVDVTDHTHQARPSTATHAIHTAQTPGNNHARQQQDETAIAADLDLDLKLGDGQRFTHRDLSGAEGSRISVVKSHDPGDEIRLGKTVRQLSRLWRYLDGGDPDAGQH